MKDQLTETKIGRIVLHVICVFRHGKIRWHWNGIVRELVNHPLRTC